MAGNGQARVPTSEEWEHLFDVIQTNRYPEKNTAIMRISERLGLRVQEIALLKIKDVCTLERYRKDTPRAYKLLEILTIPSSYAKGSNATRRSKSTYQRKSITLSITEFDKAIRQAEAFGKAGVEFKPEDFYPPARPRKGKSRELPLVDEKVKQALLAHLDKRLEKDPKAKLSDPLFTTQKGGPYSPNTLQEHMALMLRSWAGIEKARSHSGRRSLLTNIIHKQKKPVKVAQKIAGHVNPSTTIIYDEPPEGELSEALNDLD